MGTNTLLVLCGSTCTSPVQWESGYGADSSTAAVLSKERCIIRPDQDNYERMGTGIKGPGKRCIFNGTQEHTIQRNREMHFLSEIGNLFAKLGN